MPKQPDNQSLRLFIALPCAASRELRGVLDELARMGKGVKPVSAEALHVTLRFLGDLPADRAPQLSEAIDVAVRAAAVGPMDVRWSGLGRFPSNDRKPARVVYAQAMGAAPMGRLANKVDEALGAIDPPMGPPDRPFEAHLTLARLKDACRRGKRDAPHETIDALCQRDAQRDLGGCRLESVQLIASELTPNGPCYTVMHDARL